MEIVTLADKIYEEIKEKGKVKASYLVKKYKIDYKILEEWMEELQDAGLVKVVFPSNPFGDVIFYSMERWEYESIRRKKSKG